MAKQLKQILQNNPSVDYIKPPEEKKFAAKHKVLKTGSVAYVDDTEDNEDAVFKASKVKTYTRKNHGVTVDSSPKDSYGDGHPFDNLTKEKNRVVPEETVNEISKKTLGSYIKKAADSAAVNHGKIVQSRANRDSADQFTNTNNLDYETKNKIRDMVNKKGYDTENKAGLKVRNRIKGISKATDRLTKEENTNEDWATEVEKTRQSAAWWRNYHAEGKALAKKKAREAAEKKEPKNEEIVNEVSKKTLGSYLRHAIDDKANRRQDITDRNIGMNTNRSMMSRHKDFAIKSNKRDHKEIQKRTRGITLAIDKLTKEDVNEGIVANERSRAQAIIKKYQKYPGVKANELTRAHATEKKYQDLEKRGNAFEKKLAKEESEINEISNKKLGQYIGKAVSDVKTHAFHQGASLARRDIQKGVKHGTKAGKRQIGVDKAVRKITSGSYGGGFK